MKFVKVLYRIVLKFHNFCESIVLYETLWNYIVVVLCKLYIKLQFVKIFYVSMNFVKLVQSILVLYR